MTEPQNASANAASGIPAYSRGSGLKCFVQVMYDASGVRLHAGRQASVLNMIITELPPDHPVSDTRPLRDSLGHTPLQVQPFSSLIEPCCPWHHKKILDRSTAIHCSVHVLDGHTAKQMVNFVDCDMPFLVFFPLCQLPAPFVQCVIESKSTLSCGRIQKLEVLMCGLGNASSRICPSSKGRNPCFDQAR